MHALFRDSPVPRYAQLAELLRQRIARGVWKQGETLPSLEALVAEFGVARVTVRQAVDLLAREGLVSPQRGRGTFVTALPGRERQLRLETSLHDLADVYRDDKPKLTLIEEASAQPALRAEDGTPAPRYHFMRRVHSRDGEAYCVISIYLDERVFRMAPARFRRETVVPVLLELPKVKIARARQSLAISTADVEVARHLDIAVNAPVAEVRRVCTAADGTVLYLGEVTYRGDYIHFEMDLQTLMLDIAKLETFVYRAPIDTPVQTSFGLMRDRPAVFVRVTDRDGASGWGEIWCNFPTVGAEHRARLAQSVFAPLLQGRSYASPEAAFLELTAQTEVLAIQSSEPGPIAQCIAGIDIALWDLHARRLGQPLWKLLGGNSASLPVYASGLNPTQPEKLAALRHAEGYRAFKLKIGFGAERDLANLRALRETVGDCALMVDANQAWDLATAMQMVKPLADFGLAWLEEPLRANRPWSEWQQLARKSAPVLAAGENMAGFTAFGEALEAHCLGVVQPDMAKWGGFTGCLPVARKIIAAAARYCPHYLGAGIGLLASGHLLAAVGGDGMLEVDANPNPLRSLTCGTLNDVVDGRADLGALPGLGVEPDLAALREFAVNL